MDGTLLLAGIFLYGIIFVSGSSIAQRKDGGNAEEATNKNYKRQFVIYPNEDGFGHHHHHHSHHQYHEGFFDGYHGGEGMGYDADHGNMEEMDVPHYEHVHHQYKHIHHVSE